MNTLLIIEQHLRPWLAEIIASGKRVIAPQLTNGFVTYRDVSSVNDVELGGHRSDFSFKNFLFPNTETVFQYHWSNGKLVVNDIKSDPDEDPRDVVVLATTPCDAASLIALDHVFLSEPVDPFYAKRRQKLTVIGFACSHPKPECFCTSVGFSPTSSIGCDIFLTPLNLALCDGFDAGPCYIIEILTKKGQALIKKIEGDWIKPAKDEQQKCIESLKHERDKEIRTELLPTKRDLMLNHDAPKNDFDNPVWEEFGRICLGCGVCAFVCPTCTCYDLVDEQEGKCWSRCKTWDSCGFGYFTLHASGHNPRPTQMERYRQRVLHKFSYFTTQIKTNMCVGCGRCTKFCPVHLDIYDVRKHWQ